MVDGSSVSRNKFKIYTKINDELLFACKGKLPQVKIDIDLNAKAQRG